MKNLMKWIQNNSLVVLVGVVAIAIAVASFSIGRQAGTSDMEEYRQKVEQFEKEVDRVVQFSDSLQKENEILLDSLEEAEDSTIVLTTKNDSIQEVNHELDRRTDSLRVLAGNVDSDSIPEPIKEYVFALEEENLSLKESNSVLSQLITQMDRRLIITTELYENEKMRADSLQIVINTFPTDVPNPDKLFGFIPLPTRTASFAVGMVAGVATTVALAQSF